MKRRLRLTGLVSAMVVAAVNIPLGAPIAGLWVASRVAGDRPITMAAVATFAVIAAALGILLTVVLGRLGAAYDAATGHAPGVHRHVPWLRSMSGERAGYPGAPQRLSPLDVVLVLVVVAVVLAFEVWFAFFSGSPFDQRTGRE